ncbi:hypothetical protein BHM03_00050668 [Ensete ventricosum]|nr:hypothetical protein BHM03_00050668 [Ensete ventricosum]
MRLNCVKLFYAFLLCFHSERNKDRGSQPSIGAADHGQALCRGDRPWPGPLQERPATAVGAAPVASSWRGDAHRGATYGHGARLPVRSRPSAAVPTAGATAHGQGGRQRRTALPPV